MRLLLIDYGWQTIIVHCVFFLLIKGLATGMTKGMALPLLQSYFDVPLQTYHRIYAFALLMPWCLKPLIGAMSDFFPIFGKRKKYYLFGQCVLAIIGGGLLLYCSSTEGATLSMSVAGFLLVTIAVAFGDLLMEASYAERLRANGRVSGNNLVTICWVMTGTGTLVAAVLAGSLADARMISTGFAIMLCGPVLFLALLALGLLQEEKSTGKPDAKLARAGVGLAVAASFLGWQGAVESKALLFYALCTSAIVIWFCYLALPKSLFRAAVFLFVAEATSINYVGATDYFYTDRCPGLPQFSYTFYVSVSLLLGAVFSLFGMYLFAKASEWRFKPLFVTLALCRTLLAAAEVAQTARWNRNYIDDKSFFLLGEAILAPVISTMYFMPTVVLTARLTKKNAEAITYALLAGVANLGVLVSATFGAVLSDALKIGDCEFGNLPYALVFGHMALPLVTVPVAYMCLPNSTLRKK